MFELFAVCMNGSDSCLKVFCPYFHASHMNYGLPNPREFPLFIATGKLRRQRTVNLIWYYGFARGVDIEMSRFKSKRCPEKKRTIPCRHTAKDRYINKMSYFHR